MGGLFAPVVGPADAKSRASGNHRTTAPSTSRRGISGCPSDRFFACGVETTSGCWPTRWRDLSAPCTVLFSRKNGLVNLVSLRGRVLSGGLHRNHRGARVDRVQRLGDEDCGRAVGARRAVRGPRLSARRIAGRIVAGSGYSRSQLHSGNSEAGLEAHFIVRTGLASPTAYAVGIPVHDAGHTRSPSHCPFLRGIDMIFATGFQ